MAVVAIVLSFVFIKFLLPMLIGVLILIGLVTVGMLVQSVLKQKRKGGLS